MRATIFLFSMLLFAACDRTPDNLEKCSFNMPGWRLPEDGASAFRPINVISFQNNGWAWNEVSADERKIDEYLRQTRIMNPEPHTVLDVASTPNCTTAQKMQHKIHEILKCEGLCGLGTHQEWTDAPGLSGPGWVE